jgi:hypothetical protein
VVTEQEMKKGLKRLDAALAAFLAAA